MPRVTVGVSTYNRKDYLRESLKSLQNQTYKDYEIIVVDDGSSDRTDLMMREEFSDIKYIYKENGGDASAKNCVAAKADSEYLVFNDSDDLFYPNSLECLMSPLLDSPNCCSYGNYVRIDEKGNELPTRNKLEYYPSGWIFPYLVEHVIVAGCGFMMPLESFQKIGGYDEKMEVGHDYKMAIEMALRHEFFAINQPVFMRRRHMGNLSSSNYDKIKVLCDMVAGYCKNHPNEQGLTATVIKRRLAKYHNTLAREAKKQKMPQEVISQHLDEALRNQFSVKAFWRSLFW